MFQKEFLNSKIFIVKALLSILIAISIAVYSRSQRDLTQYYIDNSAVCGGMDSILKHKGKWKKVEEDLAFPDQTFPKSQYKMVWTRIDSIYSFFKEAITKFDGLEPQWYRGMRGKPFIANGPVPYTFHSLYFDYYCNTNLNKVLLSGETGTWAYVFVNHFGWFLDKVDAWDIKNNGEKITLYLVPPKVGKWKETTVYQPTSHGKFCRAIIIGHEGKLPWFYLTQKQYLTGLKIYLEEKKKSAIDNGATLLVKRKESTKVAMKVLPEDQHEKLKKKEEHDLEISKKSLENTIKYYDEKLAPVINYLENNSEETLTQTAFLDPKSGIWEFKGYFGSEDKGGIKLASLTAKYYNRELPRYAPQFMVLYWRWTEYPTSLQFKKQFEENFPLERLKAMIDK